MHYGYTTKGRLEFFGRRHATARANATGRDLNARACIDSHPLLAALAIGSVAFRSFVKFQLEDARLQWQSALSCRHHEAKI